MDLPLPYVILAVGIVATIAYRLISGRRVGSDLEGERETAVGRLDYECRACGELFDERELAVHHVSQRHSEHFPDPEDGVAEVDSG